jgi:hypothetical protein
MLAGRKWVNSVRGESVLSYNIRLADLTEGHFQAERPFMHRFER